MYLVEKFKEMEVLRCTRLLTEFHGLFTEFQELFARKSRKVGYMSLTFFNVKI